MRKVFRSNATPTERKYPMKATGTVRMMTEWPAPASTFFIVPAINPRLMLSLRIYLDLPVFESGGQRGERSQYTHSCGCQIPQHG